VDDASLAQAIEQRDFYEVPFGEHPLSDALSLDGHTVRYVSRNLALKLSPFGRTRDGYLQVSSLCTILAYLWASAPEMTKDGPRATPPQPALGAVRFVDPPVVRFEMAPTSNDWMAGFPGDFGK
jgi:hypothetical protein